MDTLAAKVIEVLRRKPLTLGTVESATGGLIAHLLTTVPGASDVFKGSIIAYANGVKVGVVGVKAGDIREHGAVSPQVARQMAAGGRRLLGVDVCVADTGIAGPGGASGGKPVGLFYLGISHAGGTYARKHVFHGDREHNAHAAAEAALEWVREWGEGAVRR